MRSDHVSVVLSNRQIAQALLISTKTVGTHLGHIYGKPGTSAASGYVGPFGDPA
jgi:DNA-binding CsgD family transcriptional regulator